MGTDAIGSIRHHTWFSSILFFEECSLMAYIINRFSVNVILTFDYRNVRKCKRKLMRSKYGNQIPV